MDISLNVLYIAMLQWCVAGNVFREMKRQPDVPENNILASGELSKLRGKLVHIISSDITFDTVDGNLATQNCTSKLLRLGVFSKIKFGSNLKLTVIFGYSKVRRIFLRETSLHYGGRAFDLTMKDRKGSLLFDRSKSREALEHLAWLAYKLAHFDFVELKTTHIHVSCRN